MSSRSDFSRLLQNELLQSGNVNPLTSLSQDSEDPAAKLLREGLEDPMKSILDGFGLDQNEMQFTDLTELKAAAAMELRRRQANLKTDYTLKEFVKVAWLLVEQRPFIDNWHIDIICETLEAMLEGWLKKVIINIPPRHMKSILISVIFPAYAWTRYPEMQFLTASYSATLSIRDAVRSRRIIESPWFQERWGVMAPESSKIAALDNLLPKRAYASDDALYYYELLRRYEGYSDNKLPLTEYEQNYLQSPGVGGKIWNPNASNYNDPDYQWALAPFRPSAADFNEYRAVLLPDQNQKHRYENTLHGHRVSTSVNGGVMGDGGDFLLMDDPLKADDAHSDTVREGTNNWLSENWLSRRNSPFSAQLLIMQRLHEQDPSGYYLSEIGGYEHIILPMEYIPEKRFYIEKKLLLPPGAADEISPLLTKYIKPLETLQEVADFEATPEAVKEELNAMPEENRTTFLHKDSKPMAVRFNLEDPRSEEFQILWQQRYTRQSINDLKESLGSFGASGQLQQEPAPTGGGKIKEHWWGYWHLPGNPLPPVKLRDPETGKAILIQSIPLPEMHEFDKLAQSWDCNFKDTKLADDVAGGVWATQKASRFLLTSIIKVMSIQAVMEKIKRWREEYPKARHIFIEQAANGPAIEQLLRREVSGIRLVTTREIGGSKMARVVACEPEIESSHVFLPHPSLHKNTRVIINQASMFPNGAKDDGLDMLTLGLIKLATTRNNIH